ARPAALDSRDGTAAAGRVVPRPGGTAIVAVPPGAAPSGLGDQPELGERGDAVVQADLLGNEAVLDLQHGDAGEPHRLARACGQRPERHVVERVAGVGATALPLAD